MQKVGVAWFITGLVLMAASLVVVLSPFHQSLPVDQPYYKLVSKFYACSYSTVEFQCDTTQVVGLCYSIERCPTYYGRLPFTLYTKTNLSCSNYIDSYFGQRSICDQCEDYSQCPNSACIESCKTSFYVVFGDFLFGYRSEIMLISVFFLVMAFVCFFVGAYCDS
jgi:hypothetical protein